MTDSDFFQLNQEQWFAEYVQSELSKNFPCTQAHIENFEFDDVAH